MAAGAAFWPMEVLPAACVAHHEVDGGVNRAERPVALLFAWQG
jgi:hypothetical protein